MVPVLDLSRVAEAGVSLKKQLLLTSPPSGQDPIQKLFRKKKNTPNNFPFAIEQLKFRHHKILKSLNPRIESKMIDEKDSDRCPSIDSEVYKIAEQQVIGKVSVFDKMKSKSAFLKEQAQQEQQKLKVSFSFREPKPVKIAHKQFEELIVDDLPRQLKSKHQTQSVVDTGLFDKSQVQASEQDVPKLSVNFKDDSRFVSDSHLQNLSNEINQRYGLNKHKIGSSRKIIGEATRPSILHQHLDYSLQSKVVQLAKRSLYLKKRIGDFQQLVSGRPHINPSIEEITRSCDMLELKKILEQKYLHKSAMSLGHQRPQESQMNSARAPATAAASHRKVRANELDTSNLKLPPQSQRSQFRKNQTSINYLQSQSICSNQNFQSFSDLDKLAKIQLLADSEMDQTSQREQSSLIADSISQIWDSIAQRKKPKTSKNPQRMLSRQKEIDAQSRKEFEDLLQQVSDSFGARIDTDLSKISYRTSRGQKIKEVQYGQSLNESLSKFNHKARDIVRTETMNEQARFDWTNRLVNQQLMSLKDDYIKQKYFSFIKENQIEIVSDIFERMDNDRKLKDEQQMMERRAAGLCQAFDISKFLAHKKLVQEQHKLLAKQKKQTRQSLRADSSESTD